MENPLVSILTPVWNEARHVGEMIQSLQAQPYANWELVIVDDGSTDETLACIDAASQGDERVRVVHKGGKLGKVRAFNLAYRESRGDIICHIGGDDVATREALTARVATLAPLLDDEAVAYFKLRMFTVDPERGVVVPRGKAGSRSGPSTTMTRRLAVRVFPVPEELPSEDLWIGEATWGIARYRVSSPTIVVGYRVHGGNSNPRHKSFAEMSESIHTRMRFASLLLSESRFNLRAEVRKDLERRRDAEVLRYEGRTLKLLSSPLKTIDRLALASMSHPLLWALRKRARGHVSGFRGK